MIVFDASSVVGAALRANSIPERALFRAAVTDQFALSFEVDTEIEGVLNRPKFKAQISRARIAELLDLLRDRAIWFRPEVEINDCRDKKDNKYLALAQVARATRLVSSDADLLTLNPWRGIQILSPRDYITLNA